MLFYSSASWSLQKKKKQQLLANIGSHHAECAKVHQQRRRLQPVRQDFSFRIWRCLGGLETSLKEYSSEQRLSLSRYQYFKGCVLYPFTDTNFSILDFSGAASHNLLYATKKKKTSTDLLKTPSVAPLLAPRVATLGFSFLFCFVFFPPLLRTYWQLE